MGVSTSPSLPNKIEDDARALRVAMARSGIGGRDLSRQTRLPEHRISEIRHAAGRPVTDAERKILAHAFGDASMWGRP